MAAFTSLLLVLTSHFLHADDPLEHIYTCLLPRAAALSTFIAALLSMRALIKTIEEMSSLGIGLVNASPAGGSRPRLAKFGRQGTLICASSFLFAASCVYRALNVADEGAYLCRGPKSIFNAPAAGRAVATIGELALVMQIKHYLEDTARRLGAARRSPSRSGRGCVWLALAAECCSWAGVLTGISRCFCVEYLCWVGIAILWAWDAAELLHKSSTRGDAIVHAALVCASLGLVGFNLAHELPHFFSATPMNAVEATPARATPFSCTHDADSPIWLSRLPFFVTYFAGASACSAILAARYLARGAGGPRPLGEKTE